MDPAIERDTSPALEEQTMGGDSGTSFPINWREALLTLVASRISIIQLESKEAASQGAQRAALGIATLICVFFTWALLMAGVIGAVSHSTGWPWFWLAIATSLLHLLGAIIFIKTLKAPATPTFSVTRSEFQKDREWLENFQKTRKSND